MGVSIWNSTKQLLPPPDSPDALPDSHSPHGPCPRCKRISNFTAIEALPVTYHPSIVFDTPHGRERDVLQRVAVLKCQGCGDNVVVIESKCIDGRPVPVSSGSRSGREEWRGIHWWPAPGMQPGDPDIPTSVADTIAEGTRCLAVQAPRAAVVMFRAALGQIVHNKGSDAAQKQKGLYQQLKKMADEGALEKTVAEWATEVRLVGNAGAHPSTLDAVSQDEAAELLLLISEITNLLYVTLARVERSKAARRARTSGTP